MRSEDSESVMMKIFRVESIIFRSNNTFLMLSAPEKPPCYPNRATVPIDKRDPMVPWDAYNLETLPWYTDQSVLANASRMEGDVLILGWADNEATPLIGPSGGGPALKDRMTFYGRLKDDDPMLRLIDANIKWTQIKNMPRWAFPLNPWKRTGLMGRGLLGKYGPNHAADPIVVQFNRHNLQFEWVAVKRNDTGQWAIPGGMVDAGEVVSQTLRREFYEEAGQLNSKETLDAIFQDHFTVFQGYSDDYRATDMAWIETTVQLFFVPQDLTLSLTPCMAENSKVQWMSFSDLNSINMFAGHKRFLLKAKDMATNHMMMQMLNRTKHKFVKASQDVIMKVDESKKRKHEEEQQ